jgi:predicted nucleic acid-binding Zn ribbon protein
MKRKKIRFKDGGRGKRREEKDGAKVEKKWRKVRKGERKIEKRKRLADNKERKRKLKLLLFVVLVAIILVGVFRVLYEAFSIVDVRKLPVKVVVRETVGLGLEEGTLFFGAVPPGGESKRKVAITNYGEESLKAIISFSGETRRWVSVAEEECILKGEGGGELVEFIINVPEGTKEGEYNGWAYIIFKKAS